MPTRDEVIEALRQVEDPELGMDIVDLGLLYDVEVEGPRVKVTHSLTSMGCPAGPMIQDGIHEAASSVPGVEEVDVELTWELTNYTVLWFVAIGLVFGGWWALSAKKWFEGPVRQGDEEELERIERELAGRGVTASTTSPAK